MALMIRPGLLGCLALTIALGIPGQVFAADPREGSSPRNIRGVPSDPSSPELAPPSESTDDSDARSAQASDAEAPLDATTSERAPKLSGTKGPTIGLAARALSIPRVMRVRVPESPIDDERPASLPETGDGASVPEDQYTSDWTDEALREAYKDDRKSLGSVSFGTAEQGRLLNGSQILPDPVWTVADTSKAYGTQEAIEGMERIAKEVASQFPGAVLRVSHIGYASGGWIRPHKSHQSGLDVDVGFYMRAGVNPKRPKDVQLDPARNWALLKAAVTLNDVQFVLVDRRIQRVLIEYAISAGESKEWVTELFGPRGIVRHARGHRDHFHIRFFAPRSQELGRRLTILTNAEPGERVASYRVRSGDNLGKIAAKFHTTVGRLKALNHLTKSFLRVGTALAIPTVGPCRNCAVPPPVVVPPRLLPPVTPKS